MASLTRRTALRLAAVATFARPALVRAAEPLNVSVVLGNAIHWVQFVAAEKGFYKDVGFAPMILALQSSAESVEKAIAGEYHLATSQPETFIAAVMRGATDLAALSAPMNHCDWILTGARGVKALAELKGQSIGLSGLRNSEEWLTNRLLAAHGFKKGDCSFVIAGTSPAKVAALERNAVGAAVLFQPSADFAVKQGLAPLARFENLRDYPTILYVVKKGWAAEDDAGKRVAQAIQRGHAWLWEPANRSEAVAILAKYTKRDDAILQPVYDDYFVKAKIYSKNGAIDLAGLTTVLDDMAEDGAVFKTAPAAARFVLAAKLGGLSV